MISSFMRVVLIIGAISNAIYIIAKIKKSQIAISEAVFWIWISLIIAIFGVLPGIPIFIAKVANVESPVNLVYLFFVALLLLKTFLLSIKISNLETKLKKMSQEMALSNKTMEKEPK